MLFDARHLVAADQAEGPSRLVDAPRAADAMDVHFGVRRDIDIDHRFQLIDVEAARGDVGSHQYRAAAIGELHQHLVAFALLQFTVQGQGDEAFGAQQLQQVATLLACIAKCQRADRPVVIEQEPDRRQPLPGIDFVKALADLAGLVLLGQGDALRLAQELLAQFGNAFRISGGKQQGLTRLGTSPGDDNNVVEEAHVQHAIGFIQHQRVERGEVEAGALQVIHDAPRRTDHDVGSMLEAGNLRPHGTATAQGQHLDVVFAARQAANLPRHLVCQLPRRTKHQRLNRKAARIQLCQQGQGKGRCLAAAGLGLGDQVVPGQRQRQAVGLDWRHLQVAELFQIRQGGRCQRQSIERPGVGIGAVCLHDRRGGAGCWSGFDHARL